MTEEIPNSTEQLFRTLLTWIVPVAERIQDINVFITGSEPFSEEEMKRIVSMFSSELLMNDEEIDWGQALKHQMGYVGFRYETSYDRAERFTRWVDVVVIGNDDFNQEFLEFSLERADYLQYMSQEVFLNYLVTGLSPEYTADDPRIWNHRGLNYLASIGFVWPSTDAEPNPEPIEVNESGWKQQSELHKLGYTVRRGVSLINRRQALSNCVDHLGLYEVAIKVAWYARNAKMRHDDKMLGAIERWEYDLDWLKKTYYDTSRHRFIWPNT